MRQGRAHKFAPLTKICGSKKKLEWSQDAQEAFDLVKNRILNDVIFAHQGSKNFLMYMLIQVHTN